MIKTFKSQKTRNNRCRLGSFTSHSVILESFRNNLP